MPTIHAYNTQTNKTLQTSVTQAEVAQTLGNMLTDDPAYNLIQVSIPGKAIRQYIHERSKKSAKWVRTV